MFCIISSLLTEDIDEFDATKVFLSKIIIICFDMVTWGN